MSNADNELEALLEELHAHQLQYEMDAKREGKSPNIYWSYGKMEKAIKMLESLKSCKTSKDVADDELIEWLENLIDEDGFIFDYMTHDQVYVIKQAITRLQAPIIPVASDDLAIKLSLATINLTNPEDAGLLQLIEQVIVHLNQPAPNPWVKIEDAENMLNGSDGPFDVWAYETCHTDCAPTCLLYTSPSPRD